MAHLVATTHANLEICVPCYTADYSSLRSAAHGCRPLAHGPTDLSSTGRTGFASIQRGRNSRQSRRFMAHPTRPRLPAHHSPGRPTQRPDARATALNRRVHASDTSADCTVGCADILAFSANPAHSNRPSSPNMHPLALKPSAMGYPKRFPSTHCPPASIRAGLEIAPKCDFIALSPPDRSADLSRTSLVSGRPADTSNVSYWHSSPCTTTFRPAWTNSQKSSSPPRPTVEPTHSAGHSSPSSRPIPVKPGAPANGEQHAPKRHPLASIRAG
ncbi:hypothetical protein K466DRAFT_400264 [Polyporus arcularius HHB13444]|uniref:Uncharacterized protein n=1 Tax=Polyporus arcularius HHB13444 TaxID=1314778 RepID=A0A5C3NTD1_9APHY|nr:hypothetical protein K466DRAFT_400264 [Polyporus arcularius HHB13444]